MFERIKETVAAFKKQDSDAMTNPRRERMTAERLKWLGETGGCDVCDSNWTECIWEIKALLDENERLQAENNKARDYFGPEIERLRQDLACQAAVVEAARDYCWHTSIKSLEKLKEALAALEEK